MRVGHYRQDLAIMFWNSEMAITVRVVATKYALSGRCTTYRSCSATKYVLSGNLTKTKVILDRVLPLRMSLLAILPNASNV